MNVKYGIVKSVGGLLSAVPFIPYDKSISIPGTGFKASISPKEDSFRRRHSIAFNVLLSANYLFVPIAADAITNNAVLYINGQSPIKTLHLIEGDHIKDIAYNDEFTVAIYDINFDENDKTDYSQEFIEDRLNKAFDGLGLDINVLYRQINPKEDFLKQSKQYFTEEDLETSRIQKILKEFPEDLESLIKNNAMNYLSEPSDNVIINGQGTYTLGLEIENYLKNIVGFENYFVTPGTQFFIGATQIHPPEANFGIIIADFK